MFLFTRPTLQAIMLGMLVLIPAIAPAAPEWRKELNSPKAGDHPRPLLCGSRRKPRTQRGETRWQGDHQGPHIPSPRRTQHLFRAAVFIGDVRATLVNQQKL